MIKTLRRKFILIAMLSVSIVLGIIILGINIINYIGVKNLADQRLDIIESNGGVFSKENSNSTNTPIIIPNQPPHTKPQKKPTSQFFAEAAFDTRYFTVSFDSSGKITYVNTVKISSVDENDASIMAKELFKKEKTDGFIGNFKYRAVKTEKSTMYIFIDCERELSTFFTFLLSSIIISIGGILVVFFLVLFFSKLALKPVSKTYEKQKQFITDAGHEIKTPITIISANTDVIESISGESEWTQSIKRQTARLRDLTDKLVYLSRTEERENTLNMFEFSLSDTVEQECASFEPLAAIEEKILNVNIEKELRYTGDESSICNLISILLDNALKYSNQNGSINVSLRSLGKNKELCVSNTVDNIAIGKLDYLFERFYRGDKSRNSETRGHGIGLAIAKAIVNAHKGKISAKSVDGKSITFTVIL